MNTQPEIRILDNGQRGYFYSPSQLEYIREREWLTCSLDTLYSVYGVNPMIQRMSPGVEPVSDGRKLHNKRGNSN